MMDSPIDPLTRRHLLTGALVFGLSFLSYLVTLCPGIYTEGSGELIGATYLLGTPHATGYPLFVLVGRVVAALLPLSPAALEINLASALFAALAAAAVAVLLASRGVGRVGAVAGGLTLAWGQVYWSQAVIAEVYGLFVGATALAMAAVLAATDRPTTRRLLLAGYLCGIAITTHLQAALSMPVLLGLLLYGLWRQATASRRSSEAAAVGTSGLSLVTIWHRLAALITGGILGLSLWLYLPLRSGRGTGFHWRDISSVDALWDHLTAADYRSSFLVLSPTGMVHNLGHFADLVWTGFTPFGLVLILMGVTVLWQRDRRFLLTALGAMVLNLIVAMNYHRDPAGLDVFFLLALTSCTLLLGAGVDAIVRWRPGPANFAMLLLPAWMCIDHYSAVDRSGVQLPSQYGRDLLQGLPLNAVLLTEGDDNAFLVDYLQRLEGVRPDVEIYNRQGRGRDLVSSGEGLERARRRWEAEARLWRERQHVFVTTVPPEPLVPGMQYVPHGLVYRLTRDPEAHSDALRYQPQQRLATTDALAIRDPWLSRLAANYWWMAGEHERATGGRAAALTAYRTAAKVAPESRSMLYNVSVRLMQGGQIEEAYEMVEAVLRLDPAWGRPYRLAADLLKRLGRNADLTGLYERGQMWGATP